MLDSLDVLIGLVVVLLALSMSVTVMQALCERFSIARTLPPSSTRFEFDPTRFATFKGVCTRANFRRDKWDIGPAFAWDRLGL